MPQTMQSMCTCRQMLRRLAAYGVSSFAFCVLAESVPIFAAAPRSSGGLGMASAQLAIPLAFGGLWLIVSALLLYPWVQARLGNKRCAFLANYFLAPALCAALTLCCLPRSLCTLPHLNYCARLYMGIEAVTANSSFRGPLMASSGWPHISSG